jgi:hypothetical protein
VTPEVAQEVTPEVARIDALKANLLEALDAMEDVTPLCDCCAYSSAKCERCARYDLVLRKHGRLG